MTITSLRNGFSVFLAGAVILFIELAGSKLLASVFGSSLYVWSALITVTLLSMAAGAWAGGWLADRWPQPKVLSAVWIVAALTLGVVIPLRKLVFPFADYMDLRWGVLLASLALFFFPLASLAAISPLVIKLSDPSRENLGRVVGRLSALGTAGSCFGALATGFFLVPHFPLTRLFLYLSFAVAFYGISTLWKSGKKIALTAFLLGWTGFLALFSPERPVALLGNRGLETDLEISQSLYGQLRIVEASFARFLFLDGILQGGMRMSSKFSISEYSVAMEILGLSAVPSAKSALVIGLGAGLIPAGLYNRGFQVEAVDINPQVVAACKRWFGLPLPLERIHVEDGRRFLRKSKDHFDLVFLDVFSGEDLPSHLLTEESLKEVRNHLTEGGAFLVNYVGFFDQPSSKVWSTFAESLRSIFGTVDVFMIGKRGDMSNFVLVARTRGGAWGPAPKIVWDDPGIVAKVMGSRIQTGDYFPFRFTDDYCPVDWLDRVARYRWRRESVQLMKLSSAGL
jgi:spermidine synthase